MFKHVVLVLLLGQVWFEPTRAKVSQFEKVPYQKDTRLRLQLVLDAASRRLQDDRPSLNDLHADQSSASDQPRRTPVIFWHGMGDTAYGSIDLERLALQRKFPGLRVYSIQIGSNALEDELASYFSNINEQIQQACDEILSNDYIKQHGSFNAIGYSQGAQFVRGLIERCPFRENNIVVRNFISLGGQHQGVYGLPRCKYPETLCDYVRHMLTEGAYNQEIQAHLVQAQYWHDPLNEQEYRSMSIFLSDINNELELNETYRKSLIDLTNLVLVEFQQDEMVIPRQSSLFGFYSPGQSEKVVDLRASSLYHDDRLGLKQLDQENRLKMISIPGRHMQYKMTWFIEQIAVVYLDN